MRHQVVLEGFGCRLRPVTHEDAAFIVHLRTQPFAQGNIHATDASVEKQNAWIARYFERPKDYYWVIEIRQAERWRAVGAIGLYDFAEGDTEAMPGRWVMLPQDQILPMTPVFLMYDFAFQQLSLKRLVLDVVATNRKVARFHTLYGAQPIAEPVRYAGTEDEVGAKMLWFEVTNERWAAIRQTWEPLLKSYAAQA